MKRELDLIHIHMPRDGCCSTSMPGGGQNRQQAEPGPAACFTAAGRCLHHLLRHQLLMSNTIAVAWHGTCACVAESLGKHVHPAMRGTCSLQSQAAVLSVVPEGLSTSALVLGLILQDACVDLSRLNEDAFQRASRQADITSRSAA